MKIERLLLASMVVGLVSLPAVTGAQRQVPGSGARYSIVVEGFDWGAGVTKVILGADKPVSSAKAEDYTEDRKSVV